MSDRNQPEAVYPGASLWPSDAPRWADHATTLFIDNEFETFDLVFTKTWATSAPHRPDDPEPDPFKHFTVTWGWSRLHGGDWQKFPRALAFASGDAPFGTPSEVASMLREVADVMDGSAD